MCLPTLISAGVVTFDDKRNDSDVDLYRIDVPDNLVQPPEITIPLKQEDIVVRLMHSTVSTT